MDDKINKVYENGILYDPAWDHYGHETNVVCDRCFTSQLKKCYGYGTNDLCLKCVHELDIFNDIKNEIKKNGTKEGSKRKSLKKAMKQGIYRKKTK